MIVTFTISNNYGSTGAADVKTGTITRSLTVVNFITKY
jgi:hypothetical protein